MRKEYQLNSTQMTPRLSKLWKPSLEFQNILCRKMQKFIKEFILFIVLMSGVHYVVEVNTKYTNVQP